MIHNDVLNQLQLLIKTSAPPLIEVAQSPLEEAQWVPGQRLTATVLASLPNGRFQVQVDNMSLDMNLPHNTQSGDQVELTFVSNQPRLTFALTRDLSAAAGKTLAVDVKPQVTVSASARYLGALLQKISDQAQAQPAPLNKTAPLLPSTPSDIKAFAASLRTTLSQSGLFYESHQAQWVAGERNMADLLREPQGKLSTTARFAQAPLSAVLPRSDNDLVTPNPSVASEKGAGTLPGVTQSEKGVAGLFVASHEIAATESDPGIALGTPDSGDALANSEQASLPVANPKISPYSPLLEKALSAYAQVAMVKTDSTNSPAVLQLVTTPASPNQFSPESTQNSWQPGQALNSPAQTMGSEQGSKITPMPLLNDGALMQGASRLPVHAETINLVQQQLQTLDSRQLVWQGQVWQGQAMEWRVAERDARERGGADGEPQHWQTSLRLQLPRLGDVQATLVIMPQGLQINLKAGEDTAALMKGGQDNLLRAMEASGLHVLAMSVERHEET